MSRALPDTSIAERGGWLVAFGFWSALLVAASAYGIVALAPKVVALDDLAERHHSRQWELVGLERQISSLRGLVKAMQSDPRMARELARVEFGAADPDEQRIAVDGPLVLEFRADTSTPQSAAGRISPRVRSWYVAPLRVVAGNRTLENCLLGLAASLTIYAFTFLRERSGATEVEAPVATLG